MQVRFEGVQEIPVLMRFRGLEKNELFLADIVVSERIAGSSNVEA